MEEIREKLETVIQRLFEIETEAEVSVPPELEEKTDFRADVATNVAMKLSGMLAKKTGEKQNPRAIAERIKGEPEFDGLRVEIAGPGFMNFMFPDAYFMQKLADFSSDFQKNISCDEYSGEVVVTEFSDPNPFKVLHIGHLYTSIMGEAISKLIEFAGGEVHRVNFGGDVGLHVAKTLFALDFENEFDIDDVARAYVEGTRLYEEDEEAKRKIIEINKEIYRIAENDLHDSELAKAYWKGRELSYKYFDQFYERIGVKFEKYYPESTVAERGLREVREHIGSVYMESSGAIVFPGEDFGLHTRVFINKEGLPTYEAKDVGLLFTKNDDYHFDESVVITGNDIIDYMKVVLKSVEQYAPELVQKTRHITHGNVRLPGNEKMSSRKGNFIKAVDILELAPLAAIKYAFLKYKIGGNIEFNAEESVSLTGNSGLYLQYSAVRAKKILQNLKGGEMKNSAASYKLNVFETRLLKAFLNYPTVLREAVSEMAPHLVCNYLFETAQEFSRFYENCKVAGSESEAVRGDMVKVFYKIMEHGLGLIGIEIPEEM